MLGQNGTDKMSRGQNVSGQNDTDKMARTKCHGQNGTDKMPWGQNVSGQNVMRTKKYDGKTDEKT